MLTVRLGSEMERALEVAARATGLTKSEFVRRELARAVKRAAQRHVPTPWELGEELFGKVSSDKRNLSQMRARDLNIV
jgi:hypothetical protein